MFKESDKNAQLDIFSTPSEHLRGSSQRFYLKDDPDNYKLPYYTISPTYSVCPDHGYLNGKHEICPICKKEVEVYSRITGYYRPVKNWNSGKKSEFKERKNYI